MSDDADGGDGERLPPSATDEPDDLAPDPMESLEDVLPDCPRCGRTIWVISTTGPAEGTASPCGCPVAPSLLERDRDGLL